jgi:hypothetical protein
MQREQLRQSESRGRFSQATQQPPLNGGYRGSAIFRIHGAIMAQFLESRQYCAKIAPN